jgi:ABC-type dipeptide/oligopeptide/nickel transport system permease component
MLFAMLFLTALIFWPMHAILGDPVVLMLGRDADPATVARIARTSASTDPRTRSTSTGSVGSCAAAGAAPSARASPC